MYLCVGLDPSLNSSGICITECDDDFNIISEKFFIIHSGKLSKKERIAEEKYFEFFQYLTYENLSKEEAKELSPSAFEYKKTLKMFEVCDLFKDILKSYLTNNTYFNIFICIEGISYGSTTGTKSIFDLAGLNYLLRYTILKYINNCELIIAPPSHIKKFATTKGNANKQMMIEAFKLVYPDFELPKIDDISDAYFMNRYAIKIGKDTIY